VVFTVRDNGVGISAPELPHVFDMYKQAPSGNNRTEGGLGIGLAVAKRMVELHGGTIVIRSDGAHCGTEVILRLPTLVEPPEVTRRVPLAAVKPARILLVDDSDDALEAVGLMLKLEGHEVRTASGGMLALSVADEFRPDVALIDIAMPTVDGFELARNLRARAALARLTLIALTGHSSEADKARSLVSGFDLHLTKPLSLEALHRFLAEQAAQTRNVGL
jgi:CheY-like chemotaxis protein